MNAPPHSVSTIHYTNRVFRAPTILFYFRRRKKTPRRSFSLIRWLTAVSIIYYLRYRVMTTGYIRSRHRQNNVGTASGESCNYITLSGGCKTTDRPQMGFLNIFKSSMSLTEKYRLVSHPPLLKHRVYGKKKCSIDEQWIRYALIV